jgi:hypothetical protein
MAEPDTLRGVIPWREGTWLEAVRALRTIWEQTESVNSLVDALRAEVTSDMAKEVVILRRFNDLNRLGQSTGVSRSAAPGWNHPPGAPGRTSTRSC